MENNTTAGTYDHCIFEEPKCIKAKFYLVVLFGTSLSLFSLAENLVVSYFIATRPQFRSTPLFFMIFLAIFDVFIAISYIFLMSVQVLMDYLKSVWFTRFWTSYAAPMLASAKLTMATSCFLILAATFERYLTTVGRRKLFSQRERAAGVFAAMFFATLFTGSIFFEVAPKIDETCPGRAKYRVVLTSLAYNYWYRTVWMFYLRNIFLVLLPFAILATMNAVIIRYLRIRHKFRKNVSSVKSAARITVSIVCVYLAANILNVVVTAWEYVDFSSLHNTTFYTFAADIVSILTVISGIVRLPIYLWCNKRFRREFRQMFLPKKKLLRRRKNVRRSRKKENQNRENHVVFRESNGAVNNNMIVENSTVQDGVSVSTFSL